MFYIVQFFDAKKSVSVVPQSWYSDNEVFWPNYTSDVRINKAVRCGEAPGQNWTRHPVKVLKGYDDYQSAWLGLKKSLTCETSELDSCDEEEAPVGRTKRKPKPIHHYGDTDYESDTESVPKKKAKFCGRSTPLPHCDQLSASSLSPQSSPPPKSSSYAAPPQPPPPWSSSYAPPPKSSSYAAPPQPPPPGSSSYAAPPQPPPPGSSSYAAPSAVPHQPFYDCLSPGNTFTELTSPVPCSSSPYPPPPGLSTFSPPPQSAPQHPLPSLEFDSSASSYSEETTLEVFRPTIRVGQSGREPIPCTPTDLHMLTLLENMKHQMNQLNTMVNLLLSRSNNAASEPTSEMPTDFSFPLDTLDEVHCFEDWLEDPANAIKKKHMVTVLASIGGRDTKHLTWNILGHMFSDGVAKRINWKGVNNKKKFSDMASKGLLARAVRKSHVAEKATDTEINHHAIRWFNLASDRGGGRRERTLAAQVQKAGVSQ